MQGAMEREEDKDFSGECASGDESDNGDELVRDEVSGSDAEDFQLEDGSDTARIAQSVTEYARRCLQTGAFSRAMVALQSAVEIAEMPLLAYRQSVFQSAQVLRAAHEFEASIACMQTIYRHMPAPYTPVAGVLIITRLYEEMQRWDFAKFWWKKLGGLYVASVLREKGRVREVWRELGDQAFEQQDFVFAADFYAQLLVAEDKAGEGIASSRTFYRYLLSLTQFTGPCDATHRQQRQLAAWRLAQRFRWNRTLYGDAHYWRLRDLYARCFPSIYRAVFEWDAVFAQRIAWWWKAHCASSEASGVNDVESVEAPHDISKQQQGATNQASPRKESETLKKTKKRRPKRSTEAPSGVPAMKMPSKTRLLQRSSSKRTSPSRRDTKDDKTATRSPNNMEVSESGAAGSSTDCEDFCVSRARESPGARLGSSEPTPDYYEASPTKRKFGAVRRLRKQRLSDDVHPVSPTVVADDESETASRPESLLELYPLRVPSPDQSFLLAAGLKPGLAELDVQKLEEFARLAHYRARVIGAQHVNVGALAPESVKPRWLLDFDKAVTFLTNFKKGKQRLEGDSIAHTSKIHARLVFQLTAIHRQYVDEFGTTTFTIQLQSLILQLSNWRFQRIAELTEALEATKRVAMEEEKRRNLEFYHVHR